MNWNPRSRRNAALFGLLLATLGSSWAQRVYNSQISELSRRTKVVGIMVLSGHQITVQTIGLVGVMPNRPRFVDAPAGLLTDVIHELIEKELALEQRYELKRVPVDPAWARDFMQNLYNRRSGELNAGFLHPKQLLDKVKDCACDAVALVVDGPAGVLGTEPGFHFGPSIIARAGAFGQGAPSKAHFRVGLTVYLLDPANGKWAAGGGDWDNPSFSDDVARYYPAEGDMPSDTQWQALADYLRGQQGLLHRALNRAGLRPSCPIAYYERDISAQSRMAAPETLPDIDPARCPIPK